MINNITAAKEVEGEIVLGTHSLWFAKGKPLADYISSKAKKSRKDVKVAMKSDPVTSAADIPQEDPEADPGDAGVTMFGPWGTVYRNNSQTLQSYLVIDGVEITVSEVSEGHCFNLELSKFVDRPGRMPVDPGLMAIIAPTKWGKTTTLYGGVIPAVTTDEGVDSMSVNYIEIYEPITGITAHYTSRPRQLLLYIWQALLEPRSVITVDSLRAFIYARSVGGTGTAGLDQYFSIQLTALSNMFAACGCLIIVTINPLVTLEDEKNVARYNEIVNQLVASTTFAMVGRSNRVLEFHPRGFSQIDRDMLEYRVIDLKAAAKQKVIPAQVDAIVLATTGQPDVSAVTVARRLLIASGEAGSTSDKSKTKI